LGEEQGQNVFGTWPQSFEQGQICGWRKVLAEWARGIFCVHLKNSLQELRVSQDLIETLNL
jgi:hypothetical protein